MMEGVAGEGLRPLPYRDFEGFYKVFFGLQKD